MSVFRKIPFNVDCMVVHTTLTGEVLNLKEIKSWMNNDLYFRFEMYKNAEGGTIFRVINSKSGLVEYREIADGDVLYYSLDALGDRMNSHLPPLWDYRRHFMSVFASC